MQFNWYTILAIAFMVVIVAYIIGVPLIQRRQMRQQQEEVKQFMADLAVGDLVTLSDGIIGTITGLGDKEAHIEIAPHTIIRVRKAGIVMKAQSATEIAAAKAAQNKQAAVPAPSAQSK